MLKDLDLDKKIEKEAYQKAFRELGIKLGELQRQVRDCKIPVIIVFEGWDAAGKGTLINELMMPMDPRFFNVYPTYAPNEEERLRPFLWRFWRKTPARGRIAIFDRSWYYRVLADRIEDDNLNKDILETYKEINYFEEQLAEDDAVIIKFFLHISKKEQKNRFKKLESNPATEWRVTKEDWKHHEAYDAYLKASEEMLNNTNTSYAPWVVVEAQDRRYASLKIFETVIGALEKKIQAVQKNQAEPVQSEEKQHQQPRTTEEKHHFALAQIDLSKTITKEAYKAELKSCQKRLRDLEHEIYVKRIPVILVFEGWDAAGKGGNIRRITENLDPRGYEVIPIAAPNDIEKAHHYLWRFWNGIPKAGHITIFDRSWYGRVMVERIEGFCTETEWRRAYREINEMEEHIHHFGSAIAKFWLHIDKEEQLNRFEEREKNPYKQWKITSEDWRNREKWDAYENAVNEMLEKTSTTYAPWTIIESNCKEYARLKTIKAVIALIESRLK